MADWLGKIRGHVGQAKQRFDTDRKEREAAGKLEPSKNIILTEREVRGEWDASRTLVTTLGGQTRPLTADDLAAFRHNMRLAEKRFKGGNGITARQVIDLASSAPLRYKSQPGEARSDIDKARKEITVALPVSALNGTIRFITNAGAESKVRRRHVVVELHAFESAAAQMAATLVAPASAATKEGKTPKQIANWLRKQKLSFDCDCERHRYFFRYVTTIGGFAAGRKETGYPKIRNPSLMGVACKHVLRAMTELESSNTVLRFLEKHLQSVSEYQARTQIAQAEAEQALKDKKPVRNIKTTEQRKAEALKAREKTALAKAVKLAEQHPPKKPPKKLTQTAAETLGAHFNLSPEQIMSILAAQANKG